jgi:hypothetical protein
MALKEQSSHGIEELTCDVTAAISIFDKRFSLQFSDIAEKVTTGDNSFHLVLFALFFGQTILNSTICYIADPYLLLQ